MDEVQLRQKIIKMRKGERIAVIPQSKRYGDESTAIGVPCSSMESNPVELFEPFEAFLEEFDGEIIRLRTATFYCLKVSIADLMDAIPLKESDREDFQESNPDSR